MENYNTINSYSKYPNRIFSKEKKMQKKRPKLKIPIKIHDERNSVPSHFDDPLAVHLGDLQQQS